MSAATGDDPPGRETAPQSHGSDAAEGVGGAFPIVGIGMSAGGLDSLLSPVEIDLGGDKVEQADIDDLLTAGRTNIDTRGKVVLHVSPTLYALDGNAGVANPLGLYADRVGVEIHAVLADPSLATNVQRVHARERQGDLVDRLQDGRMKPEDPDYLLARLLCATRGLDSLPVTQLAEATGMSLTYVCDITAGRRTLKRNPELRKKIAVALNVPQHWIEHAEPVAS